MSGKHFPNFFNAFDDGVTELFVLKMRAHLVNNAFPKFLSAFFVDRLVANDSELVRPWRYEN